jgi:hypothetical protein
VIVTRPGMASKISKKVYIYDTKTMRLIFKSDSIQNLGNIFNISRVTIRNCVESGSLFLNRFIFSVEPVTEGYVEELLSVDALAKIIEESRVIEVPWTTRVQGTSIRSSFLF